MYGCLLVCGALMVLEVHIWDGLTSPGVMVFSLGVIHFGCHLVMGVLGGCSVLGVMVGNVQSW